MSPECVVKASRKRQVSGVAPIAGQSVQGVCQIVHPLDNKVPGVMSGLGQLTRRH